MSIDLPHLRIKKGWSKKKGGLPKKRAQYTIEALVLLGMDRRDAKILISDLYWDCYEELVDANIAKPITY